MTLQSASSFNLPFQGQAQTVLGSRESVTVWATRRGQQLVCVKRGKAGGSAHQALKVGMQVRRMLKGEMACPTDRAKRKKWAEEQATL